MPRIWIANRDAVREVDKVGRWPTDSSVSTASSDTVDPASVAT
jgi:hypothetical protein